MHLQAQAILLGLALVSTVQADVSHLANNHQQSNTIGSAGHTFVAASGQIVKQSYNPNGGASYSSKAYNAGNNQDNQDRYWWMNTGASPFTRNTGSQQINTHNRANTASNGCTSTACTASAGTLNIKHDTQHANKRNDYSHNPFINAKQTPQSSTNNLFKQMAQISGSPIEVNSLSSSSQTNQYQQQPQNNYYQQQQQQASRIPCHGPTQICAPKRVCSNGLIRESDLGLVLSQSKVSQTSHITIILPKIFQQSPPLFHKQISYFTIQSIYNHTTYYYKFSTTFKFRSSLFDYKKKRKKKKSTMHSIITLCNKSISLESIGSKTINTCCKIA